MMKNTCDDKDDTAYAGTMKRSKSNQKEGGSSRDKKRSETDAQRKSGGGETAVGPGCLLLELCSMSSPKMGCCRFLAILGYAHSGIAAPGPAQQAATHWCCKQQELLAACFLTLADGG